MKVEAFHLRLATSLALKPSMLLSEWRLILKAHLQPVGFFPRGNSIMVHLPLSSKAWISSAMARCQRISRMA